MSELKKVINGLEHCGSEDMCDKCPYLVKDIENAGAGCQMFADALALLKAHEWISVKDRLPEEGVLVLVAFDVDFGLGETRQVDTAMRQEGVFCGGGLDNYLAFPCEVDVTHWMPLPEPPKEES